MNYKRNEEMIISVARAMGADICSKVAFVGGCTTGLLLTDSFSLEQVRHTEDVDLIVNVVGHLEWADFQAKLRERGFKDSISDDGSPICAMNLYKLRVDFMPDDPKILGFSNRWYPEALKNAKDHKMADGVIIRLITPEYFVATKLEAYNGRGNNDPLSSQDIEDILNIFDGRHSLVEEIGSASVELKSYISEQLSKLLRNDDFAYAVQSTSAGDQSRENWIYEQIDRAIKKGIA